MPAKPATFDRSFAVLPSDFCQDECRNGQEALPPHLNAYFMDLDEFFQATGSSVDNGQRFDVSPMLQGVPMSGFNAGPPNVSALPSSSDVQAPPPTITGMPPVQDQGTGRCEFPIYQQPMQNFMNSEIDTVHCDGNAVNESYCSLSSCKAESDEGSVVDLELSNSGSWNQPSESSGSCRYERLNSNCDNSVGSDDRASDDTESTDKYSSQSISSKQSKRRGGGKPGRKRKREYIYDPKPLQHKLSQTAVPEDLKTNDYWERRKRNNLAAKRSRENRRVKEMEVLDKCSALEKENSQIKAAMRRLEMRNAWLEKAIAEYLKGMNKSGN